MFFLHDSVKTDYFKNDKKLSLLQNGIITMAQFVNLIEQRDDYIMIGPAVVAKSAVKDFILEWKMKKLHIDAIKTGKYRKMSQEDLFSNLDNLVVVFPELEMIVNEFKNQLKLAVCPKCVKNQYFGIMTKKIKDLKDDGRDLSSIRDFIDILEEKYNDDNLESSEEILSDYEVEWIKPESMIGIGYDLIENLGNCFECTIKHIGRAKILYEEFLTGYPDHKDISFNELDKGAKDLEQAYITYLDSMSQLDMASNELIGNIVDLPKNWVTSMIDLANEIRAARLLCQENPNMKPNFDELRIKVKKLEISVKNDNANQNNEEDVEVSSFNNK